MEQREICQRFGSGYVPSPMNSKFGIAISTLTVRPLNALRHPLSADTSGWYVWGGELVDDPEFFQPLHVEHMGEYCPELVPYLGLAPGWRVQLAPGHEDVWFDPGLLGAG
jgi:hypothetical protein